MRIIVRKKKLKEGRYSLYLDKYHLGKRTYEYLNIYLEKNDSKEDKKQKEETANKIRAKKELEFANNQYGFIADHKKRISLLEYVKNYSEKRKANREFRAIYLLLSKFINANFSFGEIDYKWIEDFKEFIKNNVAPNTASNYFNKFKQCLKHAKLEGITFIDISGQIKGLPAIETRRRFLVEEELRKLYNTNCQVNEIKRAFLFSCFTGLRFSDIKLLKWGQIKNNNVYLTQRKTEHPLIIPISDFANKIIYEPQKTNIYYLPDQLIFNLPEGHWTNVILKRWFKEAGIDKHASYHLARHTFATLSITWNNDLFVTSKLLGHKNIKHTQIYANLIDKKKKEAINNLPDISINL